MIKKAEASLICKKFKVVDTSRLYNPSSIIFANQGCRLNVKFLSHVKITGLNHQLMTKTIPYVEFDHIYHHGPTFFFVFVVVRPIALPIVLYWKYTIAWNNFSWVNYKVWFVRGLLSFVLLGVRLEEGVDGEWRQISRLYLVLVFSNHFTWN